MAICILPRTLHIRGRADYTRPATMRFFAATCTFIHRVFLLLFIGLTAATRVALAGARENPVAQVDVLEQASSWVWHTLALPEMQHVEAHRLAWGKR
jgi:hypothetical protein